MTAVIVIGVVVVFGGVVFWLERRRSRPDGEVFFRTNCRPAIRS